MSSREKPTSAEIIRFERMVHRGARGERSPSTRSRRILRAVLIPVMAALAVLAAGGALLSDHSPPAQPGRHMDVADSAPAEPDRIFSGRVSRVIDGDSLVIDGRIEIRLGDFDAPEYRSRDGAAAKAALTRIAIGQTVHCTYCEGAREPGVCTSYDRVIATCRIAGRALGGMMRREGISTGGR